MLFYQIFTVSPPMRIAIWVGIAVTFVLYALSIVLSSYFAAPHVGETWDELMAQVVGTIIFPLYWAVAQGSVGTLLDMYIFILPLPIIYRLKLSKKRKMQLMAIFFIGLLGVVASLVSLVYRVKSIQGPSPDTTYNTGVLMICNLVEMDVALIVCSTIAFSSFMRLHVMESRIFKNLQSVLRGNRNDSSQPNSAKGMLDPNRPRTGREHVHRNKSIGNIAGYVEVNDNWLLHSGATTNVESQNTIHMSSYGDNEGSRVL
ncbi:hypothetical protein F4810DRAFT_298088 [Camillea tinctor]|nr:hypothetical protein F4810DRAFT_298088 [Camillea tinctor]